MSIDNILGVIGLVLLMVWVALDMPPEVQWVGDTITMRYHRGLRRLAFFVALGNLLFVSVLVVVFPPKDEGEVWAILGSYVLFGAPGVYLLVETLRLSVTVSREGLECCSPWRGRRFVRWAEITRVSYNHKCKWFVLHTHSGYVFRLSSQLVPGTAGVLAAVEYHRPGMVPQSIRMMPFAGPDMGKA